MGRKLTQNVTRTVPMDNQDEEQSTRNRVKPRKKTDNIHFCVTIGATVLSTLAFAISLFLLISGFCQAKIEHDHDVMKYLLARFHRLEDSNLETAKILKLQESLIRSLQANIKEIGNKLNSQDAAIKNNEEILQKVNETLRESHLEDVKTLKVKAAAISEDITELRHSSQLHSNNLLKLQIYAKTNSDGISKLAQESKNCSRDVLSLQTEVENQKEELKKLKMNILNLTADERNIPHDCQEILAGDKFSQSGVYVIHTYSRPAFNVYCDMTTNNGGWIVFQRRKDGSENFDRVWADYKKGFGRFDGEFWLGLDNIHDLVSEGKWELLINMKDNLAGTKYARYEGFSVGPEDSGYVLNVGKYTGDVRDSLTDHNGMKFSTRDRDNDVGSSKCAVEYKGGWWYNHCYQSALNKPYGKISWSGLSNSVDVVEMKMKRNI